MLRFLLFIFLHFSIHLLHNEVEARMEKAEVKQFPGFDGSMPSKHYAGYITVGEEVLKKHLYYYFATSERNPFEDPVTFYLMGGPGCSAEFFIVTIIGPFRVVKNVDYLTVGPKVELNPFSWTKFTNLLVIDAPTFSGYSYEEESLESSMTTEDDIFTDWSTTKVSETRIKREINDSGTTLDLHEFITKWFSLFPEFLPNPFYVAGSSYAGLYVVALANKIAQDIEVGREPHIKLKGYTSSGAAVDVEVEKNAKVPFAHKMSLISDELYEDLVISCKGRYWRNEDMECLKNLEAFEKNVEGINIFHVLSLPCHTHMKNTLEPYELESIKFYNSLQEKPQADQGGAYCFDYNERPRRLFNPEASRKMLHALQEEVTGTWIRCQVYGNYRRDLQSVIPYHQSLIKKGYRAFVYTGDHDMVLPPGAILNWIKLLNSTVTQSWRPWLVDEHVAGYSVQYDNKLLFATFKGAGHIVEDFNPYEAFVAQRRWQSGSNSL